MIEWNIVSLDVAPSTESYQDVVVTARWVCKASKNGKIGVKLGATSLGAPGTPFIKYKDLTENDVLSFCWGSGLDRNSIEAMANLELERVLNPAQIELPLPWVKEG